MATTEDAAKSRHGSYKGESKYGAGRHEFMVDWTNVRQVIKNNHGWVSKVSTDWSVAYALLKSKTIKMLLVNSASQLRIVAEAIESDHVLNVMYLKKFKMLAFRAVFWTNDFTGGASEQGIKDWNLLGPVAEVEDGKSKSDGEAEKSSVPEPSTKRLMTAEKGVIGWAKIAEWPKLNAIIENVRLLSMQRSQEVACIIEPSLTNEFVRARINAMIDNPVFG
ncbi:hypothetical protein SARC_14344 [Sphaeroforma arctica JP610]|uniref:Uncharacterized protein n=1 Tax=Sphaeroforma arctica JP610 TaxID=667725 RepID=A0A0L0F8R6_9EUKA|nr:hypothetical protein SARC_14344 [Sphaeroforma arctica JP610]KNC73100.1 hypothetical protein SARC_14344 [Sphaeroforma arctica JP610]|eukprot:XP_014147002.1 hypothetical protein SARC_14344 [Sphaeroforma arctica JP610]